ncbi:hypothetical protein ACJJTC_003845 [Scirpophaga incertulas]
MENSVVSTIEKIKLQEQDTENKLKEKREFDSQVTNLNRAIKEAIEHTETNKIENKTIETQIDNLKSQIEIANAQKTALLDQVQANRKEFFKLQSSLDSGISKVWEIRSSLCTAVQSVADNCDVRALLIKPLCTEPIGPLVKSDEDIVSKQIAQYNDRIKTATEKRDKALRERDRLQVEPDEGDEFIRYVGCPAIAASRR